MKVLKKGRGKGWTKEVDCDECDAVLEISNADCEEVSDQREGNYYSCRCPECGHYIAIDADLVRPRRGW